MLEKQRMNTPELTDLQKENKFIIPFNIQKEPAAVSHYDGFFEKIWDFSMFYNKR